MRVLPRIPSGLAGLLALLVLVALAASRCDGGADEPGRTPEVAGETTPPGGETGAGLPAEEPAGARRLFPVLRVTDGDTIHVRRRGDETIRLIGVDTPEVDWYGGQADCYGEEAGRFLQRLLQGERVGLTFDRDLEDQYDRTLAYVFLEDGRMVNRLLVRRGYAVVTIYEPNDRHEPELRAAEASARAAGRGLWGAC